MKISSKLKYQGEGEDTEIFEGEPGPHLELHGQIDGQNEDEIDNDWRPMSPPELKKTYPPPPPVYE
jgi:hypothetical protein